jgi:hypothetical protein
MKKTIKTVLSTTPWYGYVLVFVAFVAGAVLVASFARTGQKADQNATALTALCALRADIDARIEQSQQFLDANPQGTPGIPVSLIRTGLANSKRTRTALSVLDC